FECHEVLEEVWTPERSPRRLFLQSVIHVAVGCYHCERRNWAGARGQFGKALHKLAGYLPVFEGIDTQRLHQETSQLLEQVKATDVGGYPLIHFSNRQRDGCG